MAYRQWLPNPSETVGVRLDDDAMHPILPAGSIVAIDRSVTDPQQLQGRIVAACPDGRADDPLAGGQRPAPDPPAEPAEPGAPADPGRDRRRQAGRA